MTNPPRCGRWRRGEGGLSARRDVLVGSRVSGGLPTHRPGCLVLDVAMPGMNGLELHRKLIHDKITLPVIYVTGHGNVPMAVEAMQMGAVNFLEKPIQEQELWDSIRRALELDAQNRRRRARRQQRRGATGPAHAGEREVLNLILEGKMNKEIAAELGLSTRTHRGPPGEDS